MNLPSTRVRRRTREANIERLLGSQYAVQLPWLREALLHHLEAMETLGDDHGKVKV